MNKNNLLPSNCPACGEEGFYASITKSLVEYKNSKYEINNYQHICESCSGIFGTSDDSKKNKREFIKLKKKVDGIPSGAAIKAMRLQARLTIKQAGEIFGGGEIAFHKYENDDLIPSDAMVNLIKLAIKFPDTINRLTTLHRHSVSYTNTIIFQENNSIKLTDTSDSSSWGVATAIKKVIQLKLPEVSTNDEGATPHPFLATSPEFTFENKKHVH